MNKGEVSRNQDTQILASCLVNETKEFYVQMIRGNSIYLVCIKKS